MLTFLVEECHADVNVGNGDNNNQTTLIHIIKWVSTAENKIQSLLDLGADVKIAFSHGLTALDHAVNKIEIAGEEEAQNEAWIKVFVLLQAGAAFGPGSNRTYQTLLAIARQASADEAVSLLEYIIYETRK